MKEISTGLGEEKPETMTLKHDGYWMSTLIPIRQSPPAVFMAHSTSNYALFRDVAQEVIGNSMLIVPVLSFSEVDLRLPI